MSSVPTQRSPLPDTVACAFIGLLDVGGRETSNAAFSPAGTQFQEGLVRGLSGTCLHVTHIYSLRPVPSFPRHPRLLYWARYATLVESVRATLIGFINLGPVKTLSGGVALLPRLLAWAWRERAHARAIMQYNVNSPPGIVGVLAARLSGSHYVPIIADVQVPGDGLLADNSFRRADFWLQRRTLPLCDGLVVLTRKMAEDFANRTPFLQMEGALPDDLSDLADASNRCIGVSGREATRILMYAGGLSELKGIPLLLDAFSRVREGTYELWITGTGPLQSAVEEAAARDSRIKYWGFQSRPALLALYAQADVLVNPHSTRSASARYLFPSKLIEYIATGTPVITTCSTAEVGEQYGQFVFLAADDSADTLATAMSDAMRLPRAELAAKGAAGRAFVLANKTWAAQGQRIAAFISGLIQSGSSRE